jgi:hypothetical protein
LAGCKRRFAASAAENDCVSEFMRAARAPMSVSCSERRMAAISGRGAPALSAFASQRSVSAALPAVAAVAARSRSCFCSRREVSSTPASSGAIWRAAST